MIFREEKFNQLVKKINSKKPGVYTMYSSDDKIIYIGKAKNLNKRLISYLSKDINEKTKNMIKNTYKISIIETKTEMDALILEDEMIKKYKPKYNIISKDDKNGYYITIENEKEYPSLKIYKKKEINLELKNITSIGPFMNYSKSKEVLNTMKYLFKIRDCSDIFFKNRSTPCLEYSIKRCTAPCVNKVTKESYLRQIEDFKNFLQHDANLFKKQEIEKMKNMSNELNFEYAKIIKDRLDSIEKIKALNIRKYNNINILNIINNQDNITIYNTIIRHGIKIENIEKVFNTNDEDLAINEIVNKISNNFEKPDFIFINRIDI